MPPIPQFAKVLAKRAKAKPKVIKTTTAVAKKSVDAKPRKFAKDDMELAKARNKDIRESLEKSLDKKSKDDLGLQAFVNSLKRKNIKGVSETESLSYIKEYQKFLKLFKLKSGINLVSKLEEVLCKVQISKKFDIKEINSLVNKIIKKYKEVNN